MVYKNHKIIALCITQLHNEMNCDFVHALNNILNESDIGFYLPFSPGLLQKETE